jgi:DNA-binding MarR family transcriptional regulator
MWDSLDPRSLDAREPGPVADPRDTDERDAHDTFTAGLDLPRGREREHVYVRDQSYRLRGSEARTLAIVGAFRVVPASDLRDASGRAADLRHGDLERLRSAGLIRRVAPMEGERRTDLVSLTERGRELLERHRDPEHQAAQRFYAGPAKARELAHDAQLYRAYLRAAERLQSEGARIKRVILDDELKREYQVFLHEGNRDRPDSDGRPTRTAAEVGDWAEMHDLPVLDDQVQFPDFRIEYEWPDGRREREDVEVLTPHYRGAHAAAKARSGFTCYRTSNVRVGGTSSRNGKGDRPFDPDLAEEFLR